MDHHHHHQINNSTRVLDDQPRYWKRRPAAVEDGGGEAIIECSGKNCRACTAGMIADCVAICCCPCAVVNLLTLALFKVPWKIGRKWLGLGKQRRRRRKKKKKKKTHDLEMMKSNRHDCCSEMGDTIDNLGKALGVEEGMFEIFCGAGTFINGGADDQVEASVGSFETEKVWLELYQIGHLGFGRVSFTGIQS